MGDTTSSFYISQLDNLYTDPVKSNLWRVYIPDVVWQAAVTNGLVLSNFGNAFTEDEYYLHAQGTELPNQAEVKTAQINYFGMAKNFITQHASLDGKMTFNVIVPEDMRMLQALVNWNETLVRGGILNPDNDGTTRDYLTGLGKGRVGAADELAKALINTELKIALYDMREHREIFSANLVNAMCTKVDMPKGFTYTDAKLQVASFTITYDRYNLSFPKRYEDVSIT
jgi:hypothetical protein